jgi:hypothetical protein
MLVWCCKMLLVIVSSSNSQSLSVVVIGHGGRLRRDRAEPILAQNPDQVVRRLRKMTP